MIKARIEGLIEREYLERDESNMRVYKYMVNLISGLQQLTSRHKSARGSGKDIIANLLGLASISRFNLKFTVYDLLMTSFRHFTLTSYRLLICFPCFVLHIRISPFLVLKQGAKLQPRERYGLASN
jgi:hypothetical protein